MNYKNLLDRVLYNLSIDDENSRDIFRVKQDVYDTLQQVYARSNYPLNTKTYNIKLHDEIVEEFDDDTYIENFTVSGDFVYSVNQLALNPSEYGKITITNIDNITDIKFNANAVNVGGGATSAIAKVISREGEILWDETVQLTYANTDFTFTPAIENMPLGSTIEIAIDTLLDSAILYTVQYQSKNRELKLDDDAFLVRSMVFHKNDGTTLATQELGSYDYNSTQVAYRPTDTGVLSCCLSGITYTDKIIYHISPQPDGIWLKWKYEFEGYVEVTYNALPGCNMEDADVVPLNASFVDLLVYGATMRGLRRRLKGAQSEIELVGLRSEMFEYRSDYKSELKRFMSFSQSSVETKLIKPFDYFQDRNMEMC